jgi:hypothetical protein
VRWGEVGQGGARWGKVERGGACKVGRWGEMVWGWLG